MVHQFFNAVAACPAIVNDFLSKFKKGYGKSPLKLTEMFPIFFPKEGYHPNEDNISSWLDAISNNFLLQDYPSIIHPYTISRVEDLFLKLELNPYEEANKHAFQFWLLLTNIYWRLVGMNYDGRDNIFGFMTGFPIHSTKAVIIGNRPPWNKSSSGFAFHGTQCKSTKQLLNFAKSEWAVIDRPIGNSLYGFDAYDRNWVEVFEECGLTGWIEQGVLLMNAHLTHHGGTSILTTWQIFTDFIVEYLNNQMNHLVFFLLGEEAILKRQLIDAKHLIMPLYHPAFYSYSFDSIREKGKPGKDWNQVRPFQESNDYLRHNGVDPIIWGNLR